MSASRAGGHVPRTGERVARKSASRACFCVTGKFFTNRFLFRENACRAARFGRMQTVAARAVAVDTEGVCEDTAAVTVLSVGLPVVMTTRDSEHTFELRLRCPTVESRHWFALLCGLASIACVCLALQHADASTEDPFPRVFRGLAIMLLLIAARVASDVAFFLLDRVRAFTALFLPTPSDPAFPTKLLCCVCCVASLLSIFIMQGKEELCSNRCIPVGEPYTQQRAWAVYEYHHNHQCDDGGYGLLDRLLTTQARHAVSSACPFGTDCEDCGSRMPMPLRPIKAIAAMMAACALALYSPYSLSGISSLAVGLMDRHPKSAVMALAASFLGLILAIIAGAGMSYEVTAVTAMGSPSLALSQLPRVCLTVVTPPPRAGYN